MNIKSEYHYCGVPLSKFTERQKDLIFRQFIHRENNPSEVAALGWPK